MNIYYVYQYIREDQTPYYIGKGKDDRAWKSHRRSSGAEIKPKDNTRIQLLTENLTEQEAWDLEIELIAKYGLKSAGGILVNMTSGGEGGTPSQELREHWSKLKKAFLNLHVQKNIKRITQKQWLNVEELLILKLLKD